MAVQRVREAPRIAFNALTEYLVASPSQRIRVIQQQKRPKPFQVAYYTEAEEAITEFLVKGDLAALERGLVKVSLEPGLSEWETNRRLTCAEAIRVSAKMDGLSLDSYSARRSPKQLQRLHVGSLTISVRPEILLSRQDGRQSIGCIKLYISKSESLSEDRARYAGAILYHYLSEVSQGRRADYRSCFVIDVFARKVFSAPRTYKRRWQDVEAACREIGLMWPTV